MIVRHRAAATCFAAALALCASLALARSASATFHLMAISEVHADTDGGGPDHDYVELQMYDTGQTEVAGRFIRTYNGAGAELTTFVFPGNVANGQSQRTILVASGSTVLGATPDFDATSMGGGGLDLATGSAGGAVCFVDEFPLAGVDCVSFGGFPGVVGGDPSPIGMPTLAMTGLPASGGTLQRRITRRCRTLHESADDTDNSVADFASGSPTPRRNATQPSERACVTCRSRRSTITGTKKSETLTGTPARDVIAGKGGNDRLRGLGGNDIICGGKGRDRIFGGKGRDVLIGGAGNDVLRGGGGRDTQVQ